MRRTAPPASAPGAATRTFAPTQKWGTAEDGKGKAKQRSLRWMELEWEGATTAAREEARKEDVLEMLRALVEDFRRGVQPR